MKGKILQAILIVLASLLSFKFSLIGALIFIGLVLYNMFEVNRLNMSIKSFIESFEKDNVELVVDEMFEKVVREYMFLKNSLKEKSHTIQELTNNFPQMAFLDKEEALDWLKGL